MKPQISILNSFICGLITSVISAILFYSNEWYWFLLLVPVLHTVLAFKIDGSDKFILVNMAVFIHLPLCVLTFGLGPIILINGTVAMIAYYIICHGFIFKNHNINKGVFYSFIFGFISGIPAFLTLFFHDKQMQAVFISSTFLLWQTLFALAFKLSAKPNN